MGLFIGNPGSLSSSGGSGHGVGIIDTGIYGVNFASYAGGTNNRVGTRIDDAAGMNWTRSTTTTTGVDDFAGKGPFNVRECVTRWNSSTLKHDIVAYEDEDEWDTYKNNSNLNRMIEFPKFYYNRPSKWQFRVSSEQHDGFLPSPMHYRNGVMHDYVYIAKYAVDSSFMSRSGQSPKVSTTLEAFRNGIRANHMYVIDWPVWCSVAMLMLVKYANLDVQSVVGQGNSSSSAPVTNGAADGVMGKDGGIASAVGNQGSVVTFGIENWYSNIWYFIDGYFKNGTTMMINEDIASITANPNTSTWAGYTAMTSQVPTTTKILKKWKKAEEPKYSAIIVKG